jgi:hypothetical protein
MTPLSLNQPATLIAALPAVLGFVPERSLVLVTIDGDQLGCVMRVDLCDDMDGPVDQLVEVAAAAGPDGAIAVVVDADGADCQSCGDDHRELADMLAVGLAGHGIELLEAHVVDRIAVGGRWHCADGCGRGGLIDDPLASPLAASAVLDGRRLYRRRTDLEEVIAVDHTRSDPLVAVIERCAQRRGSVRCDADARRDVEAAIAAAERLAAGGELADDDVATLACALGDLRVRDTLYGLAVGACADAAEALWASLSRILPMPWRTEALVLLAFSAYARGDGPLAGISLEAALRGSGTHRMAVMLDQALQSGMRPEQIRELAAAGYRIAEDLGVRLPPRQKLRRRAG